VHIEVSNVGDSVIFETWLRFHTDIDESLKLVVPMMAFTHTALPAAMSVSEQKGRGGEG
jgi:hypothetical protein